MFDIDNLNPVARFYWPASKKTEWVDLRNIPIAEIRKLRKQAVAKNVEYYRPDNSEEKPFRYEVESIDDEKFNEILWDYQIADWHILDLNGEKIECNLENKLKLMGHSIEFAEWVVKCLNQLAIDEQKKKEKLEKNLRNSQSG